MEKSGCLAEIPRRDDQPSSSAAFLGKEFETIKLSGLKMVSFPGWVRITGRRMKFQSYLYEFLGRS